MGEFKELTLDCGVTVTVSTEGRVFKDGEEVKQHTYKDSGYMYVTFKSVHNYLVHKLVASAFIQPLKRGDRSLQVHHVNMNKSDNRLENLQILTREEHQHLHKQIYPLMKVCEVCGQIYIPHKTKRKRAKTCSHECWRKLCIEKAKKRQREIMQYNLDGTFIKKWDSARQAQNELGIHESNINKCCHGLIKSYKGYIWKYADEDLCEVENDCNKRNDNA